MYQQKFIIKNDWIQINLFQDINICSDRYNFQSNLVSSGLFANLYETHLCFMVIPPEFAIFVLLWANFLLVLLSLLHQYFHQSKLIKAEAVFKNKTADIGQDCVENYVRTSLKIELNTKIFNKIMKKYSLRLM